jgi:hypothetical protein
MGEQRHTFSCQGLAQFGVREQAIDAELHGLLV